MPCCEETRTKSRDATNLGARVASLLMISLVSCMRHMVRPRNQVPNQWQPVARHDGSKRVSMPLSFIEQPRPIITLGDEVDGPDLSPTRADPERFPERLGSQKKTPTRHDEPKHGKKWVKTPTHLGNPSPELFEVPSESGEMSRKLKTHGYTEDVQTTTYETRKHRLDSIAKAQLSTPDSVTGMSLPSNTTDKYSRDHQ
jgi:hypothetical protein